PQVRALAVTTASYSDSLHEVFPLGFLGVGEGHADLVLIDEAGVLVEFPPERARIELERPHSDSFQVHRGVDATELSENVRDHVDVGERSISFVGLRAHQAPPSRRRSPCSEISHTPRGEEAFMSPCSISASRTNWARFRHRTSPDARV